MKFLLAFLILATATHADSQLNHKLSDKKLLTPIPIPRDPEKAISNQNKMKNIPRSLKLIVWLGVWILGSLTEAGSAEPTKNPAGAEVLPVEVSKALAQPMGRERWRALRAAVQGWAAADSRAALAWAQDSTKGFEQQQLTNAILAVWTRHEPMAAATFALGLPLEKRQSWESLRQVVMLWSRNDPRAALAWAQKLDPGTERNDLIHLSVDGWASREPAAAAAFALAYPPGIDRVILLNTVAKEWLRVDPEPAWKFTKSLPADATTPDTLRQLLDDWGSRDPATALSHAEELPDLIKRSSMQNFLMGLLGAEGPCSRS